MGSGRWAGLQADVKLQVGSRKIAAGGRHFVQIYVKYGNQECGTCVSCSGLVDNL